MLTTNKNQSVALSDIGNGLASNMTETAAAMEQIPGNIGKLSGHVDRQSTSIVRSSPAIEQMLANIRSVTQTLVKNSGQGGIAGMSAGTP
jgi:methyl-accepting chemotaxis protein